MNLHEELKITALDKFGTKKKKNFSAQTTHGCASLYELVSKITVKSPGYIKAEKED